MLDNRKKIFIFLMTFGPGGATQSAYQLACGLQEKGYDIVIVASTDCRDMSEERYVLFRERFEIVNLNYQTWLSWPATFHFIIDILQKRDVDVVFCEDSPILGCIVQIALTWVGLNKKILNFYVEHVSLSFRFSWNLNPHHKGRLFFLLKKMIALPLVKVVYPRFDKIIAVSESVKEDLLTRHSIPLHKVVKIYNPVVKKKFPRQISHAPRMILACGRLVFVKDFPTLIQAFARLSERNQGVQLVIIGEGPERPKLESLIKSLGIIEKVSLPGYQTDPFPWYQQADVFVLSSLSEALPTVLIEALSCGVTPVSTRLPGAMEILDGEQYGYVVPVGDVEKMAEGIEMALQHPIDPEILRERASFFSVENSIRQYVELIEGDLKSLKE